MHAKGNSSTNTLPVFRILAASAARKMHVTHVLIRPAAACLYLDECMPQSICCWSEQSSQAQLTNIAVILMFVQINRMGGANQPQACPTH